jgi:hypothetical protein
MSGRYMARRPRRYRCLAGLILAQPRDESVCGQKSDFTAAKRFWLVKDLTACTGGSPERNRLLSG